VEPVNTTKEYTREEIIAPISSGYKDEMLDLKWLEVVKKSDSREIIVVCYSAPKSTHTAEENEIMLIYGKKGTRKYRLLERNDDNMEVGRFDEPTLFYNNKDTFIHVTFEYYGNGLYTDEIVYCIMPDGSLQKVYVEQAQKWFEDNNGNKNEVVWRGGYSNFWNMEFGFTSREDNDSFSGSKRYEIKGKYKIVGERHYDQKQNKEISDYKILVDTFTRTLISE
jgi:hypothetical protein